MKMISNIFTFFSFLMVTSSLIGQCIDTSKIDESQFPACEYSSLYGYISPAYVCGCDGNTYLNTQCAQAHGVTSWTQGPCKCVEPSFIDNKMKYILFNGAHGFPVCGCDQKSYLDPNHAYYNGVTSWTKGGCSCIDSSIIDHSQLKICKTFIDTLDSRYVKPTLDGFYIPKLKGCNGKYYRNLCDAYFGDGVTKLYDYDFCIEYTKELNFPCGEEENVVCGCNDIEYKNPCIAEKHNGIRDYYFGPCRCKYPEIIGELNSTCKGNFIKAYSPVCSCDGMTYYNDCEAMDRYGVIEFSYGPCSCKDSSFINPEIVCENTEGPICGCDNKVYKNLCEAIYKNGILGHKQCNCSENGLIDPEVKCNEFFDYDPVCGCNGRTYPNSCYAKYKAGITREKNKGPCSGTCKDSILAIPDFPCSNLYEPVCGCDNVTYDNECIARYKNGVIKYKSGKCISNTWTISKNINVKLYPNPTSDMLFINISDINVNETLTLKIFTIDGLMLKSLEINNLDHELDASFLQSGLYILHISDKIQTLYASKFIKIE